MCSLKNEKNKMNSGAFQRVNAMVLKDDMMEQIDRTFCDNVFDFENANLSKKKLRRKLEQLMPEFAKFVENSNIPGYKDKNFRILTALLTEPSKREGDRKSVV